MCKYGYGGSALEIRKATEHDVPCVLDIYASARRFMRETGNPNQWAGVYPAPEDVHSDIELSRLYVCTDGEEILGVFCYFEGVDPTYLKIYDGQWQSDAPYSVIHRIAVAESAHGRGVAAACFDYAYNSSKNVRIDTHRDNLPMQKALLKNGFVRCGIIYLANGDERVAFQKC